MEKNKLVVILLGVVILVVIAVFITLGLTIFQGSNIDTNIQDQKKVITKNESTKKICNYKDDQEAYRGAIDKKNIDECTCIKDKSLVNTCLDVVKDLLIYDNALNQANPILCDNIKEESRKNACREVAQSKIDYLRTKDPQALADIQAFSHNENAISTLEELIKIDGKKNINNLIQLALAYAEKGLNEQGQGRSQEKDVNKAFDIIAMAKEIDENNSNIYRVEGYVYEIKPDIAKAIQSYDKAIELNEKNSEAYAGRGHANRILGALDRAIEDFNKAAELDKDNKNIFIYTNLCTLYKSRGETEMSLKKCKIVTNSNNADPIFKAEAYQVLGTIYMETKKYELAKKQFMQASILTPGDAKLYIGLSKLNIYQEEYVLAEQNARKAQKLSPQKTYAKLALAYSLYMQEKYDDSIVEAQKGLKLVEGDVSLLTSNKLDVKKDLFYSIANCYRELGDNQKQQKYISMAKEVK
jgi:tetratricopeptide (TPR) repeat protein